MLENRKYRLKFMFQEIDLTPGTFVIGRSPSCNLTLEDPLVSRRHVRIVVTPERVILDDMGSRNGTLVNGEPVFENHLLCHQDRIRMGSHEMLFVEEKRYPSRPMRRTGALVNCPACRVPFPAGAAECPHCSAPIIPDDVCRSCRKPAAADDETCSSCGAAIDRDDTTIPVELGGGSAGWTSGLVNEVITKAIAAGRFEQAAGLLQGKIEDYERQSRRGVPDLGRLTDIGGYNLELARALRDSDRIKWVIEQWAAAATPMSQDTLQAILRAGRGWYDPKPGLASYLEKLAGHETLADAARPLIERLRELVQGDARE